MEDWYRFKSKIYFPLSLWCFPLQNHDKYDESLAFLGYPIVSVTFPHGTDNVTMNTGKYRNKDEYSQQTNTYSKSTIETLGKGVNYVQS